MAEIDRLQASVVVWPGEPNEETLLRLVLLIGVMLGSAEANRLLAEIASQFAREVGWRLPSYTLTRTAYYPLIKAILRWVGVSFTKQFFSKGLSEVNPIVSGLVSTGLTVYTLRQMTQTSEESLPDIGLCGWYCRRFLGYNRLV